MNKEKFDTYWKIALIVLMVLGMSYMFYELATLNKDGIACKSQPFVWGAQKMVEGKKADEMYCTCTVTGNDYFAKYSFNTEKENPDVFYP